MEHFCFKQESETLYLRGSGRLTSQNSEEFKKTVFNFLNTQALRKVLFDLSQCDYMDSTFLGVLVGIYKKMRGHGDFCIVKPSHEATQHLQSMGMDKIITIQMEMTDFPHDMGSCPNIPTKDAESILHAHKNLMELSQTNAQKFALLASVLERQVQHSGSSKNHR